MIILWKRLGLGLLLLFGFSSSLAAPANQLYQVEIIVFSRITEEGLRSEYWPLLPPQIIQSDAVALPDEKILPESQWVLKSVEQSLQHGDYAVLLHLAWQESATNTRKGQVIHLVGGESYLDNLQQVEGTIAIRLERYFNLRVNLRFILPWQTIQGLSLTNIARDGDSPSPYVFFEIDKQLRMRSNELNYIDHPLYGVLIKIIPLPTDPKR